MQARRGGCRRELRFTDYGLRRTLIAVALLALSAHPARACLTVNGTLTISGTITTNCVDVGSGGLIVIKPGGKLILTGLLGQTSTINGSIILEGDGSELIFTLFSHTVSGSGEIVGEHDAAAISIALGVTLTNTATISGALTIKGAGNFVNFGVVNANTCGTLLVNVSGTLSDSAGDRWRATAAGALLEFGDRLDDFTTSISLSGDFTLSHADAAIQVEEMANLTSPFTTTGKLTISAGLFDARENVCMGQDAPASPVNHLDQTGGAIAVAAGKGFVHH
jgi:hypothetical protein